MRRNKFLELAKTAGLRISESELTTCVWKGEKFVEFNGDLVFRSDPTELPKRTTISEGAKYLGLVE